MAFMQLFLLASFLALSTAQSTDSTTPEPCLFAGNGSSNLPPFELPEAPEHLMVDPIQSLITSYRFSCCGNITMWGAYIRPTNADGAATVSFQVWRPGDNGCFTMVGSNSNRFQATVQTDATILEVTKEHIEVQPGDIVGYLLTKTKNADPAFGIVFNMGFTEETEWYTNDIQIQSTLCLDNENGQNILPPLNILPSLNTRGPIITASVATSPCPSTLILPSTTTTTTTNPMTEATPTPDETTPPSPIDSATIIGASVGGALGGVLLISIITITIVIPIGCRVAQRPFKEKSKQQITPPLQEVFYDEIRENIDTGRYKNNLPSEHIEVSTNQAYGKTVSATNKTPGEDKMEENTSYGKVFTATKDKEEATNDESEEYMLMAPLAVQTADSDQYDRVRHV